ncbi:hypothetical protein [Streptomyces smyrnaeus]|uniref:hypothetical protein n=1 Tax=Streptomyces smyrnaeus TaxID=1387713 RepID=UPI0036B7D12D
MTATRCNGGLLAELEAASQATTEECILLGTRSDERLMTKHDGTMMAASRAVWIIANGGPGEAHVLHNCHRGADGCVNIRHLYLGDHERNMRDMLEAKRNVRGQHVGSAKLEAWQVQEIRRLLTCGKPIRAIADQYGVGRTAIHSIRTGRTWGWLAHEQA